MIFEKIQLEEDEVIIKIVRRHWFYVFKQCAAVAVLILAPLSLWLGATLLVPAINNYVSLYIPEITFLYMLWLLINWMMLASVWTEYYLDTWTITNKRIVKIDQISLFNRQIGSFRLERLQDVNVEIRGIIATLLDFGTLHAQTASGNDNDFRAAYIPKPQDVKSMILKASDESFRKINSIN